MNIFTMKTSSHFSRLKIPGFVKLCVHTLNVAHSCCEAVVVNAAFTHWENEGFAQKRVSLLLSLNPQQQVGYNSVHCSSIMNEVLFWDMINYVIKVMFQANNYSITHLIKYPWFLKKCVYKRANQQRKKLPNWCSQPWCRELKMKVKEQHFVRSSLHIYISY